MVFSFLFAKRFFSPFFSPHFLSHIPILILQSLGLISILISIKRGTKRANDGQEKWFEFFCLCFFFFFFCLLKNSIIQRLHEERRLQKWLPYRRKIEETIAKRAQGV